MKPLIIIESPGKIKAIQKYTQGQYDVVATNGGIKDLPANSMGIRKLEDGSIDYSSIKFLATERGAPIISKLKSLAKGREVYIATDPDREGEAIAFDVYGEIKNVAKSVWRVEFHEITPKGISEGLSSLKKIDMKMVEAQRTRRLIDRLVGYELTQYAASALATRYWAEASVGRTQSAALKLVYDRDEKIRNFKPEPYWKVALKDSKGTVFTSRIFKDEQEAEQASKAFKDTNAQISGVKKEKSMEKPPSPLDASGLQRLSSKKFGFSLSKTMEIAQKLYERGLITYMRTDSTRVSPVAQEAARKFISSEYGTDILPKEGDASKKAPAGHKGGAPVQDAHESVRPSHIDASGTPDNVRSTNADFPPDYFKLYGMIWDTFLASQCAPAVYDKTTVDVSCSGSAEKLTATGKVLVSPGWREILGQEPQEKGGVNVPYTQGVSVDKEEVKVNKDFTKPPAPFTLDTFVAELKAYGIGRPGTNAKMMETLYGRRYIEDKGRNIVHTDKGADMVAWLEKVCPQIAEKDFTGHMEEDLDKVAKGQSRKESVVDRLNSVLNDSVAYAKEIPQGAFRRPGVDYSNTNTRTEKDTAALSKTRSGSPGYKPGKSVAKKPSSATKSRSTKSAGYKPRAAYRSGERSGYTPKHHEQPEEDVAFSGR